MIDKLLDNTKSVLTIISLLSVPVLGWFSLNQRIEKIDGRVLVIESRELPDLKRNFAEHVKDGRDETMQLSKTVLELDKKMDLVIFRLQLKPMPK